MENWITIQDFSNYEISDLGWIRDKKTNKIIEDKCKKWLQYYRVHLVNDNNEQKLLVIHRLVAKYFVHNPNPDLYKIVLHGPNGWKDNSASNLSWGTYLKNNTEDKIRDGKYFRSNMHEYKDFIWQQKLNKGDKLISQLHQEFIEINKKNIPYSTYYKHYIGKYDNLI